jgi:hypothetical protein
MEKDLFPLRVPGPSTPTLSRAGTTACSNRSAGCTDVFHDEGGKGRPKPTAAEFVADVRTTRIRPRALTTTPSTGSASRLSTAILNAGPRRLPPPTEEFLVMEWVTMHDAKMCARLTVR